MTVRVRPVKKRQSTDQSTPENAVHFYRQSVDAKPRPTGSFLGAFVQHAGVEDLYCQCFGDDDYSDFVGRVGRLHDGRINCHYVPPGASKPFEDAPILRISDGAAAPLMWRREPLGARTYSIVSEISTLRLSTMDHFLTDLLVAPTQPWDALIFSSKTLRTTAETAIDRYANYLANRFGQKPELVPKKFVVPPGIHAERYQSTDDLVRFGRGVRKRLGIGVDDLCVLSVGNFAFYERQHPTPLLLTLEAAARRTGIRIHLLMTGWFDSDRIERSYRDAARQFAPGVNVVFLDGRDPEIRNGAYAASDVYAAFDDSIHQSIEAELLEAMARGIPVVGTDWGINRDMVQHAKSGYLISTYVPASESVSDLSLSPEVLIDGRHDTRADTFIAGVAGQMTAIDIRAGAEAFSIIADDPAHRRTLGEAARHMVAARCDWPIVIRRHQAIWSELRRIRNAEAEVGDTARAILPLSNPFLTFESFASGQIAADTGVSLASGIRSGEGVSERLERLRANPINTYSETHMLDVSEIEAVLQSMHERRQGSVASLALALPEGRQYLLPRTIAWLAKMGLVVISENMHEQDAKISDLIEASERGVEDDVDQASVQDAIDLATFIAPSALEQRLQAGKALLQNGDHSSGIAELQQAVEMAPDSPTAHYLLGAAFRRAGAAAEAVRHLERSVLLDKRQVDAFLHLAHARKSMGRRAEAIQAFRDALKLEPANLFARAGEQSLGVEQLGRKRIERDAKARRVALHFSGAQQFYPFMQLFDALCATHWPMITSDGRSLQEFGPDVIVSGGTQTAALRGLFPDATILAVPTFLASQNRFSSAFDGADIVCAPSELVSDTWQRLGIIGDAQIRTTGYLPLDPLLGEHVIPTPPLIGDGGATLLFAPTKPASLSAIDLVAQDPVGFLRGTRDDVTLVLKFHPDILADSPTWLSSWYDLADRTDRMVMVSDPDADLIPYLATADVLVTDASSVMFEYLAVDRPILLLRNPTASSDTEVYDPQGIEWRWREIAREIDDVRDLPQAVDLALKTPSAGEEVRASYRAALFGQTPSGDTADKIAQVITDLST